MCVLNPEMGSHLTPKAVSVDWVDVKKCTLVQFIIIEEEHEIVTDTEASLHLSQPLAFQTKPQFSIEGGTRVLPRSWVSWLFKGWRDSFCLLVYVASLSFFMKKRLNNRSYMTVWFDMICTHFHEKVGLYVLQRWLWFDHVLQDSFKEIWKTVI